MKVLSQKLLLDQLDRKLSNLKNLADFETPSVGWILSIRKALNLSLRQLGNRLKISAQSVKEMEQREVNKTISLKVLSEIAEALDMKFVYGFIPEEDSLEKIIEKQSFKAATEIVLRTSHSMMLEEQGNSDERIAKAIKDRAELIKQEMPRYLWD